MVVSVDANVLTSLSKPLDIIGINTTIEPIYLYLLYLNFVGRLPFVSAHTTEQIPILLLHIFVS